MGCNGGWMGYAFQYSEVYGIELESAYPFTGTNSKCVYKQSLAQFANGGYSNVANDNSMALEAAVAT